MPAQPPSPRGTRHRGTPQKSSRLRVFPPQKNCKNANPPGGVRVERSLVHNVVQHHFRPGKCHVPTVHTPPATQALKNKAAWSTPGAWGWPAARIGPARRPRVAGTDPVRRVGCGGPAHGQWANGPSEATQQPPGGFLTLECCPPAMRVRPAT